MLVLCGKSPEEGKEKAYRKHESQRTRDFDFYQVALLFHRQLTARDSLLKLYGEAAFMLNGHYATQHKTEYSVTEAVAIPYGKILVHDVI